MKAFPISKDNGHSENQDGMDLRDYFAAKALYGMVSNDAWFGKDESWDSVDSMTKEYADEAYKFADAMMKARKI